MTNEQARAILFSLKEDEYAKFTATFTPGEDNILGVRVPLLRKLAKDIAKGDWREFLENPYTLYHEECMLWGLVVGYIKTDIDTTLKLFDDFTSCIKNWAVCDCSVATIKSFRTKDNKDKAFAHLRQLLAQTDKPYIKRACIVAMFSHLVDGSLDSEILKIYSTVTDEHYYIRMAIAWGVANILATNYQVGLKLLEDKSLPIWTHNKTIQKACESFRLSAEQKNYLRTLKRK